MCDITEDSDSIQPVRVDIREEAVSRGIQILEEENPDAVRGSLFQLQGMWYITVDPADTVERQNFTIAHEIAEWELFDAPDYTIDEKHKHANHRAGELLLPSDIFSKDVWKYSLLELKMRYPHASHEVIARRSLLFRPRVLTIFDNWNMIVRIAPDDLNYPRQCIQLETETIKICYQTRHLSLQSNDMIRCEGYFIDDGRGVLRVILFSELQEEW